MDKGNVISLEIVSGWCVAMVNPRTNEPGMYWDKREKRFDGLLTIDSIFEEQQEASKVYEGLAENPVVSYKIIPVDYRIINGHFSTKLKK